MPPAEEALAEGAPKDDTSIKEARIQDLEDTTIAIDAREVEEETAAVEESQGAEDVPETPAEDTEEIEVEGEAEDEDEDEDEATVMAERPNPR